MENYLVVTTTTEQPLVNRTTEVLEDAGIPVMIEHVEILNRGNRAFGYRVLVPRQHIQSAMRLIELTTSAYFARQVA